MRTFVKTAVTGLVLALASPSVAQQTTEGPQIVVIGNRVSAEAYGRLPAVSDVAISPDGTHVALAESNLAGLTWVSIVNLNNPSERTTHGPPQSTQLRGVGWIDDQHVSFVIDRTYRTDQIPLPGGMRMPGPPRRVDIFRSGVIDIAGGDARVFYTDPENPWADWGAGLIAPIEGDPEYVRLIGGNTNFDRGNAAIYRVNLRANRSNRLTPNGTTTDTVSYTLDQRGQVAVRLDANQQSNRYGVYVYEGPTPRLLIEGVSPYGAPPSVEGLLPDGRVVLSMPADEEAGLAALFAYHRTTGERETLFQRDGLDVAGTLHDPWTRVIIGAAWVADELQVQYFDADLQRVHDAAVASLGGSVQLSNWSRDRSRFIIYAERGMDGGGFYLFTPAANTMRRLAMRYPEIAQHPTGERQAIRYRARDGVSIPAILTLPEGGRTNLPLVLLPHGGPHGPRDDLGFDWWAAFLASRGYAVLQPNYRGSGGYGQAWQEAGYRQWGGLMQNDLDDGVNALARAGIINPQRVCIVGASYGGYATLAGVTMTPERYRCGASVAGVSDLSQMLLETERNTGGEDSMSSDWWRQSIGDRSEDRDSVRAASPVNLASAVTAPVLLIHGTDDTVVPIDQSRRMLRALQGAGKNVRFVELSGDDHWLSDAPTRIRMLHEIETFLDEHLREP
ncbi:MAG: S9 family peptidase [Hyphomonadaceae bacterium]|nr:S9 family peptidase [Hyphomonadaceae bacterium]